MTRYEKDPINGRFYAVEEKMMSEKEWIAFQNKWNPKKKKTDLTAILGILGTILLIISAINLM